jgi:hypothetical protein
MGINATSKQWPNHVAKTCGRKDAKITYERHDTTALDGLGTLRHEGGR